MELYAKRGGGRGGGGGQPKEREREREREREEEGCCPGVCAAVKRGEGEGGTWRKNGMGKKEERNGRRQERREGKGKISDASWLQLGNEGGDSEGEIYNGSFFTSFPKTKGGICGGQ